MRILAIDPGNEKSAYVEIVDGRVLRSGQTDNTELEQWVTGNWMSSDVIACEHIQSFGRPVGKEVFETCYWIGRFWSRCPVRWQRVYRSEVKMHFCHSMRAKDAHVRQAIIDIYGGKAAAIGTKAKPGPLYGVVSHEWQALAVGIYAEAALCRPSAEADDHTVDVLSLANKAFGRLPHNP